MDTKSTRMQGLIKLFDLHTSLFPKAIVDITDADAYKRLDTKANHIAWIAGSLVHERFEMAKQAGIEKTDTGEELFKNHQGIKDEATYPSLANYQADLDNITPVLRDVYLNLTDEQLDKEIDMGDWKMPLYELVSFSIYREANCIGQIALWRRLLDYKGINYMS